MDVMLAVVAAVQVVLLALIALYAARGTQEQKRLNGHAARLLAERLRDEEHAP